MEPFTWASVGVTILSTVGAVKEAVVNYSNNNRNTETVSVDKRPYEPITSLCVAAIIPLLDDDDQLKIRFFYHSKVVRLCPNTTWNTGVRVAAQFTKEPYSRLQSKAWMGIALRAVCLYDLSINDDRTEAIRYVFAKAVEGLKIHLRTYKSSQDPESLKARKCIVKAITFLQCASGMIPDEYDNAEASNELRRKINQLKQQVIDQKVTFIDSRPFWYSSSKVSPERDLLISMVEQLKKLYIMKKDQEMSYDAEMDATFKEHLDNFMIYITGRQKRWEEFVEHAKYFEFPNEKREAPAGDNDAGFD